MTAGPGLWAGIDAAGIWTSADGLGWTNRHPTSHSGFPLEPSKLIQSLSYARGTWVGIGVTSFRGGAGYVTATYFLSSKDGLQWTASAGYPDYYLNSLAVGPTGWRAVLRFHSSLTASPPDGYPCAYLASQDGAHWQPTSSLPREIQWGRVFAGDGTWALADPRPDPLTLRFASGPTEDGPWVSYRVFDNGTLPNRLNDVAFANGRWLAIGDRGTLYRSGPIVHVDLKLGAPGGPVTGRIIAGNGRVHTVEESADFRTWRPLEGATQLSAGAHFVDPTTSERGQRFYRVVDTTP